MTNIAITVAGAEISARVDGILTAGMVGVPVCFSFDETWEDLEKTAVFRAGGESYCIRDVQEQSVTLPWEVLRKQGCTLYVGVYGIAADGSLAIPTLWAEAGIIQPGADPEVTSGCEPTLPAWKEALDAKQYVCDTLGDIDAALEAIMQLQNRLIGGDRA